MARGAGAPPSGDGTSPQVPWGACCGGGHNTRIWSRPKSEACLDEIRSGGVSPQTSGTAPLLRRRGGRVAADATTPESGQGRRAKRALTRFVPGGRAPHISGKWSGLHPGPHEVGTAPLLRRRGGRVAADATTPESGQGRRAKRALTRFVPGGRAPHISGKWSGLHPGPHEVGTAPLLRRRGGRVVAMPQHPNLVKAQERSVP